MDITTVLSQEFGMTLNHTTNIINLIDEGCTIPFIARYRKEMTGSCDDQVLRNFDDRLRYLRNLTKRKEEVTKSITEQEKMTDEIQASLDKAVSITEVEDIYRPFKPKRKTRASIAISRGLQPLADFILLQNNASIEDKAKEFVDEEKEVKDIASAIAGAKDIIAEMISDDAEIRKSIREYTFKSGKVTTKLDSEKENASTYQMYDKYSSPVNKTPSHRVLAINRGESEKCLKVNIEVEKEKVLDIISTKYIHKNSPYKDILQEIVEDSYDRLIADSIEREIRNTLTDTANEQAIKMFGVNLKPLLMQPVIKDKVILGLDPAYRTGCKIAVIDSNSKVLDTTVIYPTPPQCKIAEAEVKLTDLINKHKVDIISIGNGTATRESENFVAGLIKKLDRKVNYAIVNEAGASVYSASKLGASEFPEYDVALRSAVSIARRLQDPLAELIKIDVQSIGVGQYQHDMPQSRLSEVLTGVVEDCVNKVGVDVNTASPSLLTYVSGLNSGIAKNIVNYREENGAIKSRTELKKVPKLGAKAFEQCAGFLRVNGGKNILDNTGVHPESYDVVDRLLKYFDLSYEDVAKEKLELLPKMVEKATIEKVAETIGVGVPTLDDIITELVKPGRDARDELPKPELKSDILGIEDLKEGMIVKGTVRNVIDFGAFVDIGVHQDGLVHISEISNDFIKHPSDALTVGDVVKVKIIGLDIPKKRISLSIKQAKEDVNNDEAK